MHGATLVASKEPEPDAKEPEPAKRKSWEPTEAQKKNHLEHHEWTEAQEKTTAALNQAGWESVGASSVSGAEYCAHPDKLGRAVDPYSDASGSWPHRAPPTTFVCLSSLVPDDATWTLHGPRTS